MRFTALPEPVKRVLFPGIIVVVVIALISIGRSSLAGLFRPSSTQNTTSSIGRIETVSPLLFGVNLDFSAHDQQILPSSQVGTSLQRIHVQVVRMAFPENPSPTALQSMAQYVRSIDAALLVRLHGPLYPQARADNILVVQTMNSIFGKTTVYYEYGDEEDAVGVSAEQYTASWNANIPQLEDITPYAHFIGPVTYHYDPAYLRLFLKKAQPSPDEVSWHEFPCDASWSQQQCIRGIGDWSKHIASARDIMERLSGASLPIMITEWNYAANARSDDGKSNDSAFLTTWTKSALQTLATNRVFASMQYAGINDATPLVSDSDQITTQGQVMQTLYEQYFPRTHP